MSAKIQFEQQNGVAHVTLSYPKRFNAMTCAMWREAALVMSEVGGTTARQMLREAAVFSAPEMLQRNFLSRVVADVDLATLAQASVQRICQLAPQAARLNKQTFRALNQAVDLIDKAKAATNSIASEAPIKTLMATAYAYADSAEQREGITAFLNKRPPRF